MIYVIGPAESTVVKIGHTIGQPSERLGMLQTGNPVRLMVRWSSEGDRTLESHLHAVFKDYRVRGEWFDLAPLGDPVQAVKSEVEKAFRRTANGDMLLVGERFRDRTRLSPAELAAISATPNNQKRPITQVMRHPAFLAKTVPQQAGTSWNERFPPVVDNTSGCSAAKLDATKPGCIRGWKGQCHRPAGMTCDC